MKTEKSVVLGIKEIREISNYAHWLPISRGYHIGFLEDKYPGWDWNDLLPAIFAADLVNLHEEDHKCTPLLQGLCMKREIDAITLVKSGNKSTVSAVKYK